MIELRNCNYDRKDNMGWLRWNEEEEEGWSKYFFQKENKRSIRMRRQISRKMTRNM